MQTVDELKIKPIDLAIDWIECVMKNRDQGLVSWKDDDIYSLHERKQMKEQWKDQDKY